MNTVYVCLSVCFSVCAFLCLPYHCLLQRGRERGGGERERVLSKICCSFLEFFFGRNMSKPESHVNQLFCQSFKKMTIKSLYESHMYCST